MFIIPIHPIHIHVQNGPLGDDLGQSGGLRFAEGPAAGDFNCRGRSWSKEQVDTFNRLAGPQLAKWQYAATKPPW
jgi:hypothetical protein